MITNELIFFSKIQKAVTFLQSGNLADLRLEHLSGSFCGADRDYWLRSQEPVNRRKKSVFLIEELLPRISPSLPP